MSAPPGKVKFLEPSNAPFELPVAPKMRVYVLGPPRDKAMLAVTDRASDDLASMASDVIVVPEAHPLVAPIVLTIPLQLLAYYVAIERGSDVDQPRNLAKSVTVE